ncbi:IS5 family transposase [Abditibacterium utsteinense]|uniref:IS5 family transposase n=1 Tax=Abditibacterium utsteinense TaxID=1960156 RepID=UPI000D095707|nr:IS5 family transposase [Abditibacterium utsteinense]
MSRPRKVVYPSDLSDAQWSVVAPVLRRVVGHSGHVPRRDVLNAIFYVLRTGCQWRYLPQSYPNWKTVYSCFRRWSLSGAWDEVVAALRVEVRYSQSRKALPTAAVMDTQSVKTTEKGGLVATTAPRS